MKRKLKKVGIALFLVLIAIQFYQPALNQNPRQDYTNDFLITTNAPNNISKLIQASCYDCHSNNTNYPWYSYIQPARFFMESHIATGKENLNFNEWGNYSSRKQNNKLERIAKQIESNEMPLSSYTLIHKKAILTASQKKEVLDWINKTKDSISLQN
ncbi:heme-binding domain-containing protein [Flavobacterium sp. 102]|uniref:heme-binding domain-containing protein n=1 Tax=Flavobacterium sp. 102 TaxID=2135623 RepID=UPI000EAF7A18|nr:heme-binding domain-containing protein [Flavobacterium sp. 102]RKS03383.1 heme-binding protein [Flavobacterium sp. 102]